MRARWTIPPGSEITSSISMAFRCEIHDMTCPLANVTAELCRMLKAANYVFTIALVLGSGKVDFFCGSGAVHGSVSDANDFDIVSTSGNT